MFFLSLGGDGAIRASWPMLVAVFTTMAAGFATFQKLATQSDLSDHVTHEHVVVVAGDSEPTTVKELAKRDHDALVALPRLEEEQRRQGAALNAVRDQIWAMRADAIADSAATRPWVKPTHRDGIRRLVRDRVLANLQNGKRVDEGVEQYLAP